MRDSVGQGKAYEKVIDYIQGEILKGDLKRGEKLPPERELAELLGLTPGSVTPFGALNDKEHRVTILLDEDYRGKLIGVHPNDNTATVWLPADALVELLRQQGTTVEFIPF